MNAHQLPDTGFVRLDQIIGNPKKGIPPVIPVCRATWYAGIKDGRFPPPEHPFGTRISLWNVNKIKNLIESVGA